MKIVRTGKAHAAKQPNKFKRRLFQTASQDIWQHYPFQLALRRAGEAYEED